MKILIFLLFLVGCGNNTQIKTTYRYPDKNIDPCFTHYLDMYIEDTKRYGALYDYTEIQTFKWVKKLSRGAIGRCSIAEYDDGLHGYIYLLIEEETWSETYTKYVIYHELGHCLTNLKHIKEFGIMSPYIIADDEFIEDNWDDLVSHMFTGEPEVELDSGLGMWQRMLLIQQIIDIVIRGEPPRL